MNDEHAWSSGPPRADRESWAWTRRNELMSVAVNILTTMTMPLMGSKHGNDPVLNPTTLEPDQLSGELRKFVPIAFDLAIAIVAEADKRLPRF